jgi:hypothetical protein
MAESKAQSGGDGFRLCDNSEEFIELMRDVLDLGHGIVPLIGSGMSATAGVPTIRELSAYLKYCIARALPLDGRFERTWRPSTDAWPPLRGISASLGDAAIESLEKVVQSKPYHPLIRIYQQAIGSSVDWRTSLLFLSRLRHFDPSDTLWLGAPDYRVVDQFFLHVVSGKVPSLAHRMLAMLADRLRLQIILTTNFDELLEQAFDQAGSHLTAFDVHLNRILPSKEVIVGTRALIKLHGGRYGLRADYSLDAHPAEEDRKNFTSYFGGPSADRGPIVGGADTECNNHLFVVGCSASDRRICAFIEETWQRLRGFTVFWVCHTPGDVKTVRALADKVSSHEGGGPRLVAIKHSFLPLLLVEVFQILNQGLPPRGIHFPTVSRLPVPPSIIHELKKEEFNKKKEEVKSRYLEVQKPDRHRLVTMTSNNGCYGVTSVGRQVFEEFLDDGMHCLWFDMDDVVSADDLFEQMLEGVVSRSGVVDWMPMVARDDFRARADVLEHFLREAGGRWVIFLNAREAAGVNLVEPLKVDGKDAQSAKEGILYQDNGWIDRLSGRREELDTLIKTEMREQSATPEAFIDLLDEVCLRACNQLTVILLCRAPQDSSTDGASAASHRTLRESRRREGEPAAEKTKSAGLITALRANGFEEPICIESSAVNYDPKIVIEESHNFLLYEERLPKDNSSAETSSAVSERPTRSNGKSRKRKEKKLPQSVRREHRRFLTALVLMQRTRYITATVSEAFVRRREVRNVWEREAEDRRIWDAAMRMVRRLERHNIIRRKTGGFIWMHCSTRDRLRNELRAAAGDRWNSTAADIHWHLALWYEQLFLSSLSASSAFEVVYHCLRCIESSLSDLRSKAGLKKLRTSNGDLSGRRIRIEQSFCLLDRILWEAEPRITHRGFSQGSIRRLNLIRLQYVNLVRAELKLAKNSRVVGALSKDFKKLFDAVDEQLQAVHRRCLQIMAKLSREVAEHVSAFRRWRQLRQVVVCGETNYGEDVRRSKSPTSPGTWSFPTDCLVRTSRKNALANFVVGGGRLPAGCKPLSAEFDERLLSKHPDKWVDFQRHVGLLCLATRAYTSAHSRYVKRMQVLLAERFKVDDAYAKKGGALDEEVLRIMAVPGFDGDNWRKQSIVLAVAKLYVRWLQLDIARFKIAHRMAELAPSTEDAEKRRKSLRAIEDGALSHDFTARELLRSLSVDQWKGIHEQLRRIDMFRAVLEAVQGRRVAARGFLGSAFRHAAMTDPSQKGMSFAVIELHRADVCISEALVEKVGGEAFSRFVKAGVVARVQSLRWRQGNRELRNTYSPYKAERFQVVRGLLGDAASALDRAYPILLQNEKNVWWSTWYFERRLKVIELDLWSVVGRCGEPLPYVGWQASPEYALTDADHLLAYTTRMVRLDVYRLAIVIETYANIIRAVYLHLAIDPGGERLRSRIKRMRDTLDAAKQRLTRTLQKRVQADRTDRLNVLPDRKSSKAGRTVRHSADRRAPPAFCKIEPDVYRYARNVEEHAEKTLRDTQKELI